MGLWFLKCRILLSYLHATFLTLNLKFLFLSQSKIVIRSCIEFEILPHKEFRPIVKERRNNC